ncbi:MAG: hypothetical protein Q8O28_13505 [Smithellaceae bacterium]|nr:hypothetical protein [Smithellaceae bacterium]
MSALRLAEKGYKVAVLEKGKRWNTEDFPKTNWSIRKNLWLPVIGCYGYQMLTQLKHVLIFHGGGVGGGSLVYANQLLVPPDEVFKRPEWGPGNWKEKLSPVMIGRKKCSVPTRAPRSALRTNACRKSELNSQGRTRFIKTMWASSSARLIGNCNCQYCLMQKASSYLLILLKDAVRLLGE